ncbi:MAG: branched-chain amino acid ABC transporter ATP-binding protein [Zestosphaera tikiterensis]|uniref:Branched-chain amino acid ABC transporter ATP-binding protein n=1 Tax=Zestosphaera tikiterensis TaxID=1973259 RepID=A0A2R7Y905_9CREN|nr:MAG: branched-chain amino acid ABC transporter ATP-binding protein [Zestosphaera tikiterensis]
MTEGKVLKLENIETGYRGVQVLWGVNVDVGPKEIVAVLGPNGAGKTTLMKATMGFLKVWKGSIIFLGRDITKIPSHERVKLGITLVPEGRSIFPNMTVEENLMMGAYMYNIKKDHRVIEMLEVVYNLFPILQERRSQKAGTLSGGQQQMLAIGRALMTNPKILLLDEPTLGLAPKLAGEVLNTVAKLRDELGLSILLVEEKVLLATNIADRIYIMNQGRIEHEFLKEDLTKKEEILQKYIGF